MSTNYIVMFTAGGRLKGAKIGPAELLAMQDSIAWLKGLYPDAIIYEKLGMAKVPSKEGLENSKHVWIVTEFKPFGLASITQESAPWHLSNISNSVYDSYEYTTTGKGVKVYVFDTGIDTAHAEFEGRAFTGKNFYNGSYTSPHGTHVAGIIGSKTYGVAKECHLIDVMVFDNIPLARYLLDGINWVLDVHPQGEPGVVNMSLGGPGLSDPSREIEISAMLALVEEGLIVCVSAGNDTTDTVDYFPGGIPEMITVGASDVDNAIASFSNFGEVVDIFAPGVDVLSTMPNNNNGLMSGTSMASPVVTGICARYLELCPGTTQQQMQAYIKQYGAASITGVPTGTTTKRVQVDMLGVRIGHLSPLSSHLNGQFRHYYYQGANRVHTAYEQYKEVNRLEVLQKATMIGTRELATEVLVDTTPPPDNPEVSIPVILPPDIITPTGTIHFIVGFYIVYNAVREYPEVIIDNHFEYPCGLNVDIANFKAPPVGGTYNGQSITFTLYFAIMFNGVLYNPTSINGTTLIFNYPGVLLVEFTPQEDNAHEIKVTVQDPITPLPDVGDADTGMWPSTMQDSQPLYKSSELQPTITKLAPIRNIVIDVAPAEVLTSINMNLQFASGTFSYSGLPSEGLAVPNNKDLTTIMGHNGVVERVAAVASRGQADTSIEGRLLPLFTSELVYIRRTLQNDGTPFLVADLIADVAELAGVSVSFSATNNKVKELSYTGRFTQVLSQLAELACGRLLQQNGQWFILPKHKAKGSFNVKAKDLISWQADNQSDISDTIASLASELLQAMLDKEMAKRIIARIEDKINHASTMEALPADPAPSSSGVTPPAALIASFIKQGEIGFNFGWDGNNMVPINEDILIEGPADIWEYWKVTDTPPNTRYYKVENVTDSAGVNTHKRGLKTLAMVDLLYPITEPSNLLDFWATGTLVNISCWLWGGTEFVMQSMTQTYRSKMVSAAGEVATPFSKAYFLFKQWVNAFGASTATTVNDEKLMYTARMHISYRPTKVVPWKFAVNIAKDYRIIEGLAFMIPLGGGAVLTRNGATVCQYDRVGKALKTQSGTIIGIVNTIETTETKTTYNESENKNPRSYTVTYSDTVTQTVEHAWTTVTTIIRNKITSVTAPSPVDPGGTTLTIAGAVVDERYPLRTKAGRLFGYVHKDTGAISSISSATTTSTSFSEISTYVGPFIFGTTTREALWGKSMGDVVTWAMGGTVNYIGVVLNADATDASGTISFNDSVSYPAVSSDSNFTDLINDEYEYEKAKAEVDVDIAEAKIKCIKKEFAYYGIPETALDTAAASWKIYYDAIEVRDYPKITIGSEVPVTPKTAAQIKAYETTAIDVTGSCMAAIGAYKPVEGAISCSFLYDGTMPLAGQELTCEVVENTNIDTKTSIIETVSFNGSIVSLTAKRSPIGA